MVNLSKHCFGDVKSCGSMSKIRSVDRAQRIEEYNISNTSPLRVLVEKRRKKEQKVAYWSRSRVVIGTSTWVDAKKRTATR